jgi:dihydrofolate reductase
MILPRPHPAGSQPDAAAGVPATPPEVVVPLVLIAAVAANGVIGTDNRLPWRLADDLRRFRALTTGHTVIMGRRTWESLPRALPGRQNIVVTRRKGYAAPGADVASSLDEALGRVRMPFPVFCIGGGELYRAALPRATTLELTEIARDFEGDVRFPPIVPTEWREVARREMPAAPGEGLAYAFVTCKRIATAPTS